ncbi:phosphonate ABC transporter ATP-binding protein [Magnetovibrio sp. PR-2]|uniref:phosphonate ABC transporter ATP-binding protein n=1 Tax=Magnetovibrio sp. PR-2 TaxID=3120356 RepID=UPI002FCDEA89
MDSFAEHVPLDSETVGEGPANTGLSSTGSVALKVEGLRKTFGDGSVEVFRNVSFEIPEGQAVALIGANGAGKSTLLRCCLRLIEPDEGKILINDTDLSTQSGRALRKSRARVSFVFQKHNLVPRLSVLSNVCHGSLARGQGARAWFHGFSRAEERDYAYYCLEQVGLADLAARRADHLSGGQSQRVAIARALMQRPELLFADEPTASLDPYAGEEIMELFRDLNQRHELTFVFVSHDLEHALGYADRVLGLKDKGLALDSSTHEQTLESLRGLYG